MRKIGQYCVGFVLVASCIGCGKSSDSRNAVHGEVKCDGRPLARGSITFVPVDGTKGNVSGGEIKDGRYALTDTNGPWLGWQRVEIHASKNSGRKMPKPMSPTNEMMDEEIEAIPTQYNSASTLKIEIKPGDNTANFEVTSK